MASFIIHKFISHNTFLISFLIGSRSYKIHFSEVTFLIISFLIDGNSNNNKIYCNGSCTFNRFLIVQAGYDRCSCAQMIIEGEGSVAAAIGA